jgi:hypothetical protein
MKSYIRKFHPLTLRHRLNILRKSPAIRMKVISFSIHPVNRKSTGETTGGVVGKRNRNIVTNDQLNNLRCKRGLVEKARQLE